MGRRDSPATQQKTSSIDREEMPNDQLERHVDIDGVSRAGLAVRATESPVAPHSGSADRRSVPQPGNEPRHVGPRTDDSRW